MLSFRSASICVSSSRLLDFSRDRIKLNHANSTLHLLTLLTAAMHSDKAGRKSKYVPSEQICVFVQLVVDESEPFR